MKPVFNNMFTFFLQLIRLCDALQNKRLQAPGTYTNQAEFRLQALCIVLMKISGISDIITSNSEMKCSRSPQTVICFLLRLLVIIGPLGAEAMTSFHLAITKVVAMFWCYTRVL